ncbi:hypothetical protein EZE20_14915 [Arundinibacter roseus]|uniref:Uncharacterized protein n=2 Tax=Arundinibacter roseus TaxID=2070510 RepID=A0A4R4K8Z8_9BACT|nr:hypothetical protein EZE20_14915 [Arundinibacter roseus]
MRPQDILILAQLTLEKNNLSQQSTVPLLSKIPQNKTLATLLKISEAEVSESLRRSEYAGLLADLNLKSINKKAFLDFIMHGLPYVFPARPGALVRGVPTAQSAPPLSNSLISEEQYVWEYADGTVRGQRIEPLYPTVPEIAQQNPALYEVLSLIDAIRTGSPRTIRLASQELEKRIISHA